MTEPKASFLALGSLLSCLCLSVTAWAGPPAAPAPKRAAVLVVPLDLDAEALAPQVEGHLTDALREFSGLEIKTPEQLFGAPPDDESEAALKKAEAAYLEGKAAFENRRHADAEKKLLLAIHEFEKAASAMNTCGHLCDVSAMYAATLMARGETEQAKIVTLELIALNPTFELDRKKYPQEYVSLRAQVATSRNAQLRGTVNVTSRPSGARVFLDGEAIGYAPMTLPQAHVGKHLLKLERPGFKPFGQVIEVTADESDLNAVMTPGTAYRAYSSTLSELAAESSKETGGPTMAKVGKSLGLDRAVIAVLKSLKPSGATELSLSLFELSSGKRLSTRRGSIQGDEFGQLKGEVTRALNQLITSADATAVKKSKDPLGESHAGTDEWSAEDKGGKSAAKEKQKKRGDPLDGVNGTEEW